MQNTTNYNLKKPEPTDNYDIQDQNDNMDIVDAELKTNADLAAAAETPAGAQAKVDELAGVGRETETVKGNADALAVHQAHYVDKFPDNAGAHNSIYRGKYLGSSLTAAQQTAISGGTFEDLYIGDYWTMDGVNYRIAAFNYYYNAGDTALTDNHVTLVPDTSLYNHVMNDTNITTGGYIGSKMYTEGLDSAKATIDSAFGAGNIVSHRKYLSNAVTDGETSGAVFATSKVELMNEFMVFGGIVAGRSVSGVINRQVGVEKSQLPLFSLRPDMANIRVNYWLRDVVSAAYFAFVHIGGLAHHYNASNAFGVRPVFSIS